MKSGELKKVAQAYTAYLPEPWKRVGNEFLRHEGDWVQIIAFNPSRFSEQYVPRSCMEFLKMPGVPTGGFLVQELQNSNRTQRWVKTTDVPGGVFEQMAEQFKPSPRDPVNVSEIKSLLGAALNYWPHPYALCVKACQEGNASDPQRYFQAVVLATSDKPYPWAETRKHELAECMKQMASPEVLRMRLESLRNEKLCALKLKQ